MYTNSLQFKGRERLYSHGKIIYNQKEQVGEEEAEREDEEERMEGEEKVEREEGKEKNVAKISDL